MLSASLNKTFPSCHTMSGCRAGLKPIGPIALNWAQRPILQTLVQVDWEPGPTEIVPSWVPQWMLYHRATSRSVKLARTKPVTFLFICLFGWFLVGGFLCCHLSLFVVRFICVWMYILLLVRILLCVCV